MQSQGLLSACAVSAISPNGFRRRRAGKIKDLAHVLRNSASEGLKNILQDYFFADAIIKAVEHCAETLQVRYSRSRATHFTLPPVQFAMALRSRANTGSHITTSLKAMQVQSQPCVHPTPIRSAYARVFKDPGNDLEYIFRRDHQNFVVKAKCKTTKMQMLG